MAEQWFLKEFRKELGLRQVDVGKDSGLSQLRISELELGRGYAVQVLLL